MEEERGEGKEMERGGMNKQNRKRDENKKQKKKKKKKKQKQKQTLLNGVKLRLLLGNLRSKTVNLGRETAFHRSQLLQLLCDFFNFSPLRFKNYLISVSWVV